jgi:hypothetical protein
MSALASRLEKRDEREPKRGKRHGICRGLFVPVLLFEDSWGFRIFLFFFEPFWGFRIVITTAFQSLGNKA